MIVYISGPITGIKNNNAFEFCKMEKELERTFYNLAYLKIVNKNMKKNEIIPFGYDDKLVRTVMIDNTPWFVAKDVCAALGIQNHKDSVAKSLDDDEKGVEKIYFLGGVQETIVINESGLYTLVMR